MQDAYERPIKNGESPLGQTFTHAAQCAHCREIKPVADFKTHLTRAQAVARGYKNNYLVEIDSSICKSCRPKPKPLRKLTVKEMQNRVTSGALSEFVMEKKLEERAILTRGKRVEAALSVHAKRRASHWAPILQAIIKEINKTRDQKKYAKANGYAEVLTFAETYHQELVHLRTILRMNAVKPDNRPDSIHWQDHVTEKTRITVRDTWDAIPMPLRIKMRLPALLDANYQDHAVPIPDSVVGKPAYRLEKARKSAE
jgi:hypothetical protein